MFQIFHARRSARRIRRRRMNLLLSLTDGIRRELGEQIAVTMLVTTYRHRVTLRTADNDVELFARASEGLDCE